MVVERWLFFAATTTSFTQWRVSSLPVCSSHLLDVTRMRMGLLDKLFKARAPRNALKTQLGTLEDDDDPDHRTDHMDSLDWSEEMETFLRFVDAHR